MTRLALLSDIHGNLPALEAVMDDMQQFSPDQVVVAGDIINWGPFSAEVTQIVLENHWSVIRGNNEYYLLNAHTPRMPRAWEAFTMLDWLRDQMADYHAIIAGWADTTTLLYPDAPAVTMFHGQPDNPWNAIFPHKFTGNSEAIEILGDVESNTVFCGHSHIALDRLAGRYHIVNPGSVGVPLHGQVGIAEYMILDGTISGWQVVEHRHVAFDIDRVFQGFEARKIVDRCGPVGLLVIEEFLQARLIVHTFHQWCKAHNIQETETYEAVDTFLKGDVGEYAAPAYRF